MPSKNNSRRKFIKNSALASSLFIVPRNVLGGEGFIAPSDKVNIAGIGLHGQGQADVSRTAASKYANIVALCDVHPNANGSVAIRNKFPDAEFYIDYREMIDKNKDIDAVIVTTPDHTHANIAEFAMLRNKHVYVQKPLTHNVKEARHLTLLAKKQKVVTQMGNQGSSNPDQKLIQKWIKDGKIGKVDSVDGWTNRPVWPQGVSISKPDNSKKPEGMNWDLWAGPEKNNGYIPGLHAFDWRGYWDYGTGSLGDMGCHLMDVPIKALGLYDPYSVEASISRQPYVRSYTPADVSNSSVPASSIVTYRFNPSELNDSKVKFTWMDGGLRPSQPEQIKEDIGIGGILIHGEKGIISCNDYGTRAKLYIGGEVVDKGQFDGIPDNAFNHYTSWVEAIVDGYGSDKHKNLNSGFDVAGPISEVVLLGNVAVRTGLLKRSPRSNVFIGRKRLDYDSKNMIITNFEQANQFLTREYRKGWELNI